MKHYILPILCCFFLSACSEEAPQEPVVTTPVEDPNILEPETPAPLAQDTLPADMQVMIDMRLAFNCPCTMEANQGLRSGEINTIQSGIFHYSCVDTTGDVPEETEEVSFQFLGMIEKDLTYDVTAIRVPANYTRENVREEQLRGYSGMGGALPYYTPDVTHLGHEAMVAHQDDQNRKELYIIHDGMLYTLAVKSENDLEERFQKFIDSMVFL